MSKKFNKLFFSTLKRTARIQRQALKRIGAPGTKRSRKAKKPATPKPTIGSVRPETVVAVASGKGKWGNHIHSRGASQTALLPRLPYSLYRPPVKSVTGLPLVIMLHGCQQLPYELAEGTRMNELADQQGFVVVYPQQAKTPQFMRCRHWIRTDTGYGLTEADSIADLARSIVRKHRLNPARIYVAGLSAGAGMAGLIALRHPDVFAAVAMHSGAALGSAHNATSGLRAM